MNSWLSDTVDYYWQIAKLESWHWGVVIYNQIVTRTAFAILAMFDINIRFKTSHERMACCYLIFGRVRTLPKRLPVKKVPPSPPCMIHKEQHDQWSLTTSWDCSLFKLRSKYSTWWDSLKFTSSGKSEALKQMGVELTIRGPSKPSVEFCHIVLIGIGRPQLWSHLIPSLHPSNQTMKMDNIQSRQLYNNQLRSMDTSAYFNLLNLCFIPILF